jgi:hypothetical protein
VNPRDLKDLRVPLTKIQNHNNILNLPSPSLLLLPLLRMGAKVRETMMKIPVSPNSPNQLPKNLLQRNKRTSTPSP